MKTLIMDSNLAERAITEKLLSPYGECVSATTGEEGVQLFREALEANRPFELICLDIVLPGKDGYRIMRDIRETEKRFGVSEEYYAKIVVISAINEARNIRKAFDDGANAYAGKPISPERFVYSLQRMNLM